MPIQTKEYLKTRFETGDKPTAQDFIDLFDSLLGINQTPDGQQTIWQPPNSPVYLGQGQELTLTHPSITNEIFSISVNQEIPGESGQTNISMDFAQAAEGNYIQEDALYGTDFINGAVLLHGTFTEPPATSYSNYLGSGNRSSLITMTSTWNTSSNLSLVFNGVLDYALTFNTGSVVGAYWLFDFKMKVYIDQIKVYIDRALGTGANAIIKGSNDSSTWTTISGQNSWSGTTYILLNVTSPNLYRYYKIECSSGGFSSNPCYQEIEFKIASIVYPTKPYYVVTTDLAHFSFAQASLIQSLSVTSSQPAGTAIKCAASFDGRKTWKKWDVVQWVEVSDFEVDNNSITDLQKGFVNMAKTTEEFIDLVFILSTTNPAVTPSIDQVTIVYTENSHYEMATVGAYTSSSDFGLKRVNATTTLIKRINNNSGKAFITLTI